MKLHFKCLVLALFLSLTACSNNTATRSESKPLFNVALSDRVSWTEGHSGYEAEQSAYYLTGDIGSITLRNRSGALPRQLVFVITTSKGLEPMLEGLTVYIKDIEIKTSLSINHRKDEVINRKLASHFLVDKGKYLNLKVIGDSVWVTLTPKTLALIEDDLTLSWVDWYR